MRRCAPLALIACSGVGLRGVAELAIAGILRDCRPNDGAASEPTLT